MLDSFGYDMGNPHMFLSLECVSNSHPSFNSVENNHHGANKFHILNKEWQYRGEGNANLVLALPKERKIIRLHKSDTNKDDHSFDNEYDRVKREVLFCQKVIIPLIGSCFIQEPLPATIDKSEVKELNSVLHSQRPATRIHKHLISGYATIYPDYALLPLHLNLSSEFPVFCVEIKPKQGWIAVSDRRTAKCTFCLNQYLKLKSGAVKYRSQYCPLDLFSGNFIRMEKALKSLISEPQNNLKIFQNGIQVYGEDNPESVEHVLSKWLTDSKSPDDKNGLIGRFCKLVLQALTRELKAIDDTALMLQCKKVSNELHNCVLNSEHVPKELVALVNQHLPDGACDWTADGLPDNCILNRILTMQKLDKYGTDCAYASSKINDTDSKTVDDYAYVNDFIKSDSALSPLHCYLLAATAKDCSIMLAFQQFHNQHMANNFLPYIICDEDRKFVFNAGVSDLDPKPASSVLKHCKRDCNVLHACLDLLKVSCVDASSSCESKKTS